MIRKRDPRQRIAVEIIIDDLRCILAVELTERNDALRSGELFQSPCIQQHIFHGIIVARGKCIRRGIGHPFHKTAPRQRRNIVRMDFAPIFQFNIDPFRIDERNLLGHDRIRIGKHCQFRTDFIDAVLNGPFPMRVIECERAALGSRPQRISADIVEIIGRVRRHCKVEFVNQSIPDGAEDASLQPRRKIHGAVGAFKPPDVYIHFSDLFCQHCHSPSLHGCFNEYMLKNNRIKKLL